MQSTHGGGRCEVRPLPQPGYRLAHARVRRDIAWFGPDDVATISRTLVKNVGNAMNPERVGEALSRIGAEVQYAQTELQKLKPEGDAQERTDEAGAAFEAIYKTIQFDVSSEWATLLQKLGLGPLYDVNAIGPPEVNARFILDWLWDDLASLEKVIRRSDESAESPTLGVLLRAVGTEMLTAFAVLQDELEPLLKRSPPER
jgi:hypothetical protein